MISQTSLDDSPTRQTTVVPPKVRKPAKQKPAKPRKDWPLFPHNNGQWAKKVNGKLHYFGPWDDPHGAMDNWLDQKDALLAGREPKSKDDVTLGYLASCFIDKKLDKVEEGELAQRTYEDYKRVCVRALDILGRDCFPADLTPDDFARLRSGLAKGKKDRNGDLKRRGPKTLTGDITVIRMMFRWALKHKLLDEAVWYGDNFDKPKAVDLRKEQAERAPKIFRADEILALLDAANVKQRAMILLGINCGYGNGDCGTLRIDSIEDDRIDYPRPKTGINRRCILWPETIEALQLVIGERTSGLVFTTKRGNSYHKAKTDCPIAKEFAKLQKRIGIQKKFRGFYSLRHNTQTIGEEIDLPATRIIMGHSAPTSDMSAVYGVDDGWSYNDRIKRVSDHIRAWLFKPVIESLANAFEEG